jgi:hypothetical protein
MKPAAAAAATVMGDKHGFHITSNPPSLLSIDTATTILQMAVMLLVVEPYYNSDLSKVPCSITLPKKKASHTRS